MPNNICAGIVLYNPNINGLRLNIEAIKNQVETVFLQDNGSLNVIDIENLIKDFPSVVLLKNPENKGIAWAMNSLCEKADLNGYQWMLTLDQDSVCPEKMVENYKKYLSDADMLCPKIIDRNYGVIDGSEKTTESVEKCITSGCLLKLSSWRELHGFDEKMFIDGVDFEFCYRMKKSEMNILRINEVVLNHEIGNITVRRFLGLKVIVKNHSAFRKYYIAKNIIYMARKRKSCFLIVRGLLQEIKLIGIVLLYENDRRLKLKRITQGMVDGFKEEINEW